MLTFFSRIIDSPRIVIVLLLIPTVFFGSFLPRLEKDTDVTNMLPRRNPVVQLADRIEEEFGVRDSLLIGVVEDGKQGIYNPDTLRFLFRLTKGLEALPGIEPGSVKGIFTIDTILGTPDGFEAKPLLEEIPETEGEILAFRRRVGRNAMIQGEIVSRDGTGTLILADPESGADLGDLYDRVRTLIGSEEKNPKRDVFIAGTPVITGVIGTYVDQDMRRMIPFVAVVIVAMLALLLRSIRGVVLPLLVIGFSVIWTMGAMAILGIPIYPMTTIVPILIMALGCADGIHVTNRYYEAVGEEEADRRRIILKTMAEMWRPVVMTSLTTTVGFLSLLTSDMEPIRYLGIFSAFGILVAMLFSLTFLPASLALLKVPEPGRRLRGRAVGRHRRVFSGIPGILGAAGEAVYAYRYFVVSVNLVLILVSLALLPFLRVDSDPMRYFEGGSDIPEANRIINAKFNGTGVLNVVLDGGEPDAFKSPALLVRLSRMQRMLEKVEDVGGTISLADYLKLMNRAMHGDRASWDVVPETREEVAQYLLLYSFSGEAGDLERVVDDAFQKADLIVRLRTLSSTRIGRVVRTIEDLSREIFGGQGVTTRVGGRAMVTYITQDILVKGQLSSIELSIFGVFLITVLMFRSFLAGLLSILPITVATIWNFGFMSLARVPLEPTSAVTACIGIGVGIDYAIHFISKYRYLAANVTPAAFPDRIQEHVYRHLTRLTMMTAGKAILFNALVVICGFLVLLLSRFPPTRTMGILVSLNMFACFVGAVTLLPAAVNTFRPRFCCRVPWEAQSEARNEEDTN